MDFILPKVIGHRGACGHAPENTLASFAKAFELGATWIECDVTLTKDEQLVIFHDDKLSRMTNGRGYLVDHTLAELKELNVGKWYSRNSKKDKIPTLLELIQFLKSCPLGLNLELKPPKGYEKKLTELVLDALHQYWSDVTPLLLSSFSSQAIEILFQSQCRWPYGYLSKEFNSAVLEFATLQHCYSIHCKESNLNAQHCQTIKNANFKLLSYTVNRLARAESLWNWGVDSIFSDYPERFISAH